MKITMHRYLIKEQLTPLAVSLLGLSFVLVTGRLLQLMAYLFTSSASLSDISLIVLFALPKLMLYTLPMATLLGILLAFIRLNGDNELIALRTAGIGFKSLLPAVMPVLLSITLFSAINALYIVPLANKAFELKLKSIGRAGLPVLLKEGTFIDAIPNMVLYFRSVTPSDLSLSGIFVQDQRREDVKVTIVAEKGQIAYQRDTNLLTFKIFNGIITRVPDSLKDAQAVTFKAYDLVLPLNELMGLSGNGSKSKGQMTLADLLREIRSRGNEEGVRYALELHERLALPVGCLLLGLLGAPLGALFQKGRLTGITIGLMVFLAYYVLLSAGNGLAKNGLFPPSLAMWAPNAITLLLALYLWDRVHHEKLLALAESWTGSFRGISAALRFRGAGKEQSY